MKSFPIIFFLLPALISGSTNRQARVVLENLTGNVFKFQVLHQYTDESTDDSGWHTMKPGESKQMFSGVRYRTGFLTTGADNWKVHGSQLIQVSGLRSKSIPFLGKFYVDGLSYASWHGALASWKKHTLRSEDDGKTTTIKVYPTEIQFVSPSGTSTTRFDKIGDTIGRFF